MNTMHFTAGSEGATTVSDKMEVRLSADTPQSQLLEESFVEQPFATFFASTWAHYEPWPFGDDLQKPASGMWLTPMLSDEPARPVPRWRRAEELAVEDDLLAKATNDRITLLARKYVVKERFSEEERARLAIVTERVRQLLPAVTASEFESLEKVLELAKQVGESDADIRLKLGISDRKNG